MKLTAQAFQAIVRSIRAQLPQARERSAGGPVQGTAKIVVLKAGGVADPVQAAVTDLTTSGISFVFKRPLKTDERFMLLLKSEKRSASAVLYTVVRWHPIGKDLFSISANFTRELHTPEMSEETLVHPARFCAHDETPEAIDEEHRSAGGSAAAKLES